ncbi:MAG: DUF3060 domain-containing protein [Xanthomonadales bacterium]|nr:DUF3060 domain-containing protein [Xanthomonadales bacterium]
MPDVTLPRPFTALLALGLLALALPATAEDDGGALFVNSQEGVVECEDRDVNVTASKATLAFTGHCKAIHLVGDESRITVEKAELVQASGNGIRLTARGAIGEVHLVGSRSRFQLTRVETLRIDGDDNHVEAKKIGRIEGAGGRNDVQWSSGKPEIDDLGSGNTLQRTP